MKHKIYIAIMILTALGLTSCQNNPQAQKANPSTPPTAQNDTARDSAQFAYELSTKQWCTNDDACSLVLMLVEGKDLCQSFDQRVDRLKGHQLLRPEWTLQADKPVTKGTLAYMVCKATDIKGGLFMQLFPSRRYAYREALYQNLIQKGSDTEPLTGPEAIGVLGRAARRQSNNQAQTNRQGEKL